MSKKVLFIGGGNMAEGIIDGLIKNKVFAPANIFVNDVIADRLSYLENTYGISITNDVGGTSKSVDFIVIAVRPQDAAKVTEPIRSNASVYTMILSICAGLTLETLENLVGEDKKIVKVMPNTLIRVQKGFSAACINKNIDEQDKASVIDFLSALGQYLFIEEKMFDTFTAYSCTGPLYVYYFISALIDAGVYAGFSRKDATAMTIKNVSGAAEMLEIRGSHPFTIIDAMTSPGGVGIEALYSMNENALSGIIQTAVKDAVKKANSLG